MEIAQDTGNGRKDVCRAAGWMEWIYSSVSSTIFSLLVLKIDWQIESEGVMRSGRSTGSERRTSGGGSGASRPWAPE